MHVTLPVLLCLIAGSIIFFLISLYYVVKFAVRDGIVEADRRTAHRKKDDTDVRNY